MLPFYSKPTSDNSNYKPYSNLNHNQSQSRNYNQYYCYSNGNQASYLNMEQYFNNLKNNVNKPIDWLAERDRFISITIGSVVKLNIQQRFEELSDSEKLSRSNYSFIEGINQKDKLIWNGIFNFLHEIIQDQKKYSFQKKLGKMPVMHSKHKATPEYI